MSNPQPSRRSRLLQVFCSTARVGMYILKLLAVQHVRCVSSVHAKRTGVTSAEQRRYGYELFTAALNTQPLTIGRLRNTTDLLVSFPLRLRNFSTPDL